MIARRYCIRFQRENSLSFGPRKRPAAAVSSRSVSAGRACGGESCVGGLDGVDVRGGRGSRGDHSICAWAAAGVAATIRARRLQTSRVSVFHRRCATTEPRHLFSGNSVSSTAAGEPTNPTITPSLHDPHLTRRPRLTVTRSVVCWRPLTGRALRPRRAIADTRPAYRAGFEPTALTHTGHLPVKGRLRVADVQNRELT